MPNRIIKESICASKGLSECSIFAEDLYKRLIVYADDYGRFNADTEIMLARLYPRELQYITEDDLIEALIELAGIGKVAFYTSQPRRTVYGCLPKWEEHQRVRNTRAKCPDPDDTTVNDWYYQRFIPISMKEAIIKRDNFKCQICGKPVSTLRDARRLVKLGEGTYNIDHIVPVAQGGRATFENLRLTCPSCNKSRKRRFTMDEILGLPIMSQSAASCGELSQSAAIIQSESNPIQSESESESKSKKKIYGEYKNVLLTDSEYERLQDRFVDYEDRIERLSEYIASKGKKYSSHYATINAWARKDTVKQNIETHVSGTDEIKRLLEGM